MADTDKADPGTADPGVGKLLADRYGDWAADQGVPLVEDFGVDLKTVETGPWPRLGSDGAIVHLKGRGDFVAIFLIDLPPGGQGAPQRHLIEEVVYVISGHGSMPTAWASAAVEPSWAIPLGGAR